MDLSNDDLLALLARQSNHISRELQTLLDAQSDGLTRAMGGVPANEHGEMTDTSSVRSKESTGQSQPLPPQSPGDSSAASRDSIYRDDPLGPTSPSTEYATGRRHPRSSSRSTSHTQSQSRLLQTKGTPIPVRQPPPPKAPTLRRARTSISDRLRELASIKDEEASIYQKDATRAASAVEDLTALGEKRSTMESKIVELESTALQRADYERQLASEEDELAEEIAALERRLEHLKSEARSKRLERESLKSEREAEVSSWKNALNELDEKVKNDVLSDKGRYAGGKEGRRRRKKQKRESKPREEGEEAKTPVWALPESRRTLEMVKEEVEYEIKDAETKRQAAHEEARACEEGAKVWDVVVKRVLALESRLARDIKRFHESSSSSRHTSQKSSRRNSPSTSAQGIQSSEIPQPLVSEDRDKESEESGDIMRAFLDGMDAAVADLSGFLALADEHGWTLLQCCIGAELEALHRGREILGDTLVQSRVFTPDEMMARSVAWSDRTVRAPATTAGPGMAESSIIERPVIPQDLHSKSGSMAGQSSGHTRSPSQRLIPSQHLAAEEEDVAHDGPDPQLLFGGDIPSSPEEHDHKPIEGPELLVG